MLCAYCQENWLRSEWCDCQDGKVLVGDDWLKEKSSYERRTLIDSIVKEIPVHLLKVVNDRAANVLAAARLMPIIEEYVKKEYRHLMAA